MKTHAFAKALRQLAHVLESGPNVDIANLQFQDQTQKTIDPKEVALSLTTLISLSRISKQEWVDLINNYKFSINLGPRDSARDIIGKLLRYLDKHPEAIDMLKKKAHEGNKEPTALSRALDVLLDGVKE
ncbi:MAG: hypothetical protein C4519_24220 [Desulfobacteraceae bacterium]|nr:MAG: hypothetical protein C4519_24220 [Desulfobacteraceae bacterium]